MTKSNFKFSLVDDYFNSGDLLALESNFNPRFDLKTISELKKKHKLELVQVICKTKGEVLLERFKQRSESG